LIRSWTDKDYKATLGGSSFSFHLGLKNKTIYDNICQRKHTFMMRSEVLGGEHPEYNLGCGAVYIDK
jgi:hypothetical protein